MRPHLGSMGCGASQSQYRHLCPIVTRIIRRVGADFKPRSVITLHRHVQMQNCGQ